MSRHTVASAAVFALLVAIPVAQGQTAFRDPGAQNCAGAVPAVPGLRPLPQYATLRHANGAPGQGLLCNGRPYKVEGRVTVYRVWDSGRPDGKLGEWWALEPPAAPPAAYRIKYAMCPSQNRMDRVVSCNLRRGTHVMVGTGQSMDCGPGLPRIPPSPAVQVYIPKGRFAFEACLHEAWP